MHAVRMPDRRPLKRSMTCAKIPRSTDGLFPLHIGLRLKRTDSKNAIREKFPFSLVIGIMKELGRIRRAAGMC